MLSSHAQTGVMAPSRRASGARMGPRSSLRTGCSRVTGAAAAAQAQQRQPLGVALKQQAQLVSRIAGVRARTSVRAASGNGGPEPDVYDTVVVGAGISGLVTAQALATKHADNVKSFLVTESRDRVGGNITSLASDGYVWEEGPNSFQPNDSMLLAAVSVGKGRPCRVCRHLCAPGQGVSHIGSVAGGWRRKVTEAMRGPRGAWQRHVLDVSALCCYVGHARTPRLPAARLTNAPLHPPKVEAGVADQLVFGDPTAPRFVFWQNKLRPVPSGLDAFTFDLMSIWGKIRAGLGAIGIANGTMPGERHQQGSRPRVGEAARERRVLAAIRTAGPACAPLAAGCVTAALPFFPHPAVPHPAQPPTSLGLARVRGERGAVHPPQPGRRGV
jgi:hypothetical protein